MNLDRSQSLVALLRSRAEETPDRGYTWLAQGEQAADRLTYANLDCRARAVAAALVGTVLPGERALLLHPPGLEFVAAFFGCLYAGVIAVPAYPPPGRRADRLRSIATDCRPRAVLTIGALLARREALADQVPELASALWLDTETLNGRETGLKPLPGESGGIAFLQYTSGSTGTPKGVVVTHANLLDNLERIRIAFGQTPESVVVGWLPLFHDMGLIGNVLEPCYVGCECVLMSPAAFLQKPARWLEAIDRFHGTTSGGPNFAYDLCARSIGPEARAQLDLSSWSVAFNGAEPVRRATLDRFAEVFAPCGFRRESFAPCYGLAEATLLATAARGASDEPLVSCGALPDGDEARIVDPESGAPVLDGQVGEIWLSGPSVAAGYWNRPEETRETFGAVSQNGAGPYLRTGDLGFVRRGELVVTGRLKDLIVLRGRNLYPQDLELTAEQAHPALRAGGGAAFSIERGGEESVIVVHEVDRRAGGLGEIANAVRSAVAEEHGVPVADVVLLRAGTIPKTSSGKIRRRECRARYLAGDLQALHRSATAPTPAGRLLTRYDLLDVDPEERSVVLTDWLREEIARRAGIPAQEIGPDMVIGSAGLDSLALFDLQGRLERDLGLALPAASLAELSVAELCGRLLDAEPGIDDVPPVVSGEILGDHPVSPGQESLWLFERSASAEGVLHIAAAARLGSKVGSAALLRAALSLSARHPALRTTFAEVDGGLRQWVHASLPPDLAEEAVVDLDGALRREARRRFDLAEGPPLRLRIFTRPDGERVLLLVLHHLVGDFWSVAVLLRDWAALQAGLSLPHLPVSYTDFVRWQLRLLESPSGERLERYWLDRLKGAPLVLDLPTDRPRPRVTRHEGSRLDLRLDPVLTGRLRALGRAPHGATLFTTLLAAFQALLGRLSGQDDLVVGCPATARRDSAFEGVVGYFVNPVVLRADLAGEPTFSEHLAKTRQAVTEALEHRDLPFSVLARNLEPLRDPGRPPVFQALFVHQGTAPGQEEGLSAFAVGQAGARIDLDGLVLESYPFDPGTTQFDVTLSAAEVGDALILSCEHDAALFDRVTIGRWLGHLETLLEAAAAHREARLGDLPLLSEAELHQTRIEWNPSGAAPDDSLVEMFESWVDRAPEAVAVLAPGEALTYAELDRRANQLARRLLALGVTIDSRVGLCVERSPGMIAAVLGILKTGAAYVPLDPAYPRERLAFMVEDARIQVLLTEEHLLGVLPETAAVTVLLNPHDPGDGGRLPYAITPDSLAYVIYTSGSTGRPKGAMIPHRGWSNLADAQRRWFGLGPGDRVLQFASLGFDASAWEISMAFGAGATLVLGPRERRLSREELTTLLAESTAALLPPTVLATLSPEDLPGLSTLIVGGEACPVELARVWAAGRRLWNAYGPTEASVCATVKLYDGGERLPIGRPIPRMQAHVLDARGNPVPIGVTGELCLGGPGLARGYLDRPDRTAASFVPHPLAASPGERLYRTGDLARFRPDGEIEFLGRIDHQVKVRGFRIEPGEIEAALVALPGVREAAVVAREDVPGDRRLVAYIAGDVEADALRRALRERLPEHLVPSGFVTLAALPLTPSGKVDRTFLSALEGTSPEESYLAPRTPVEEILAGIWADVLATERVGATDHFFDLGGHSLLATQVVSRVRTALGVEIPLRDLFEAPTLSGLAARVETVLRAGSSRPFPPLVPLPRERPLPLSFVQQRLWFLDQLEPGGALYNMPGAFRIEGQLDCALLAFCLGEIVRRHEALRTVFAAQEGVPVQVIELPAPFALPVVDLSGLPESAREAQALVLLAEEAVRPFDLVRGPLLRGGLLRLAEEEHVLALTVHHIVSDGWSMGILIRELAVLPLPLPKLPVQYADYAVWQRSWLQGEVLEREIAFWREQLDGVPALLDLSTDRPRPAVQSFRGASRPIRWPAELTRRAEALARREGATLFMVLLATFQALLARYSGQEDLAVGSPIAGRNQEEIEGLIGFFVNTLVLRGDLSGEPSFRELLGRVRETALAAYMHQDVPFEKLVEDLAPERNLTHSPLFQVMFVLQNAPLANLEIRDLRIRPLSGAGTAAKFDLTLSLEQSEGGMSGVIEYATDLFDGATIERLLGHFELLLTGAVSDQDRLLADLPMLSRAELHQVQIEWNPAEAGLDVSLVERFESWVDRTPDAVAVVSPEESLTYTELERRANCLAHRLRALGVKIDSRVGLCAERSPAMIAGVLGILKAGAAYVPLDPAYPRERLAFMVDDARIPVLLTEERLLGSLPETKAAVALLEVENPSEVDRRLPIATTSDSLAYVIYTSGSTGRPKGVMIPHRGWSNLADAQRRFFGLGPGDRVLQFASLSFDGSAWEIAMAFGAGATLVLGPRERRFSQEELTALLKSSSIAALPPTVLATLDPGDLPELKTLIVAGEACPPGLARRWSTGRRLFNSYGPTETSVCATMQLYDHGERLPIGTPITRMQAFVLDARGNPVPIGTTGEICLGGAGLARGYLGRPDRTAASFVPHPFPTFPGERLYRTGDLGRWLPYGSLEFLGRTDHQVKIRGVRIELGEIEAALAVLPGVREAVVVVREEAPGDRRLVAYVTGEMMAGELRGLLKERLPDSMVPSTFVMLAALPLTANGKVDRKALPAPELSGARESYVAPRTREEELLAAVWAQVLRLPRVGIDDNFFELGGDSILSVQIVARCRQAGLLFTVRQIFEHQTVAELARYATLAEPSGAVLAGQGPVTGEVPLTPIQRWFFEQGFADPHHFNQALLLESREALDPAALERAMGAIVEHHDALRMRFERSIDGWRQENPPAESVPPFYLIDLSGLAARRVGDAFEQAAAALQAGFDLGSGSLTRLCLFEVGAGQPSRLLWVTHHLVVDGISWRLLIADLEGAYRQAERGLSPTLPPKTSSFQAWSRRLAAHASSAAVASEMDYWRETALVPVPLLPVDFPEAGALVGDRATVSFGLSAAETADLLQTLPAVFHSRIDEALLSALARAVSGWTGAPRLRVDLEGHGREPISGDLDVSRTVGWFTSLYPVVLEAGDAGPGEALVSAKERLRAVPERGIGYGLLRHRILPEAPAAEISFNYLGQVDATFDALSLFRPSSDSAGPMQSVRAHRAYPLEINGIVSDGRLRIDLMYGRRTHRRETVERLAAAYAGALRELIQYSRESEEVFTPSDFPKAGLDARSFESLATLLAGRNVEDLYPLTPLQNGMLFHSLMAPDSGVYVTQVTCTLPADLDTGLFRQAWERLIDRHSILRTAFLWDGLDEPLQVVNKRVSISWQELDWCGLSADEQERRFEELRHRERHTPLPLGKAPLMRFSLIRFGREHGLIWTAHHLLMDGWSLPLLVQELQSIYASPASSALPPVRPFSDYVVWVRKQDPSRAEPFWREELAGFTTPNALGIDRPARIHEGAGYAEHGLRISREITARLQALAARHKLTLPTVTLGAWAVLVSRYSREEDVVFGNVVSGRPAALPSVETMVGMFINTLPVRVRVNGAEALITWLQRLQERQLARQEFEHAPLAQIQRWSEIPAGSSLFETLHVFESYPNAGGEGSSSRLPIGNLRLFESTNYPVTLTLTAADQVSLRLTSDRARVEEDLAPRLLQHLATLLTGMAEEPRCRVGELRLLTAEEALQLRAWNETAAPYLLDRPLHAWIEDQAARSPEAVAVAFESEELTYRELDRRAGHLASRLQALGCGPESRVGVLLERSCELLVTLLGILKAGAAYVPLDPDHPADRLAFQDRDARLRLIVTRAYLASRLPGAGDRFLFLDGHLPDGPLSVAVDPDHPAYVLYTSGSTGRPKGVVISHRAIVNRLLWMQEALCLTPTDRVLQKTPFSFDVSVWELFWPLMAGARLVVARPGGHLDNAYLARLIDEQGITVLHFVPSLLQLFLEDLGVEECRTLRDVVCSGEALSAGLARRFAARLGHVRLHNLYGPTEAAVDVTSWVCETTGGDRGVPIGRPVANTRIHLLDPDLLPVPVGIPGELFIAGVNLARGYVERPDLTAERFLPDPEGREPGERTYRTGDLARWREDGAIEYLGRLDHQVKIRGVRIELGEIEAALAALPGVREAVVVAREEASGDRRLVAYVTGEAAAGELRGLLKDRLPDSMVPSAFVTLPALPLTSSGKVDRKALPAPDLSSARKSYVAPRNREEELLASVWAQVLRLSRVGVDDNFFELGGDSILSIQIVARSRQAGLLFTVRQIFEHQTVAELARHATLVEPSGAALAAQDPVAGEVPFTPIQRWFFEQGFADPHHFNQALLLESREALDPAALERAVAAIVEHHDALRMRFERTSEGWRQENAPAESVPPFYRIDLSGLAAPRVKDSFEQAVAALQAGFDLGSGPLTRLCLFEIGAGQPSWLLWVTHHLVVDGVSWRLLLADLEAAYRQAERGLSPALPPKTSSFQDWSRRLAAHESSAVEVDFWREIAQAAVPHLPVDFPETDAIVGDEATVSFELSVEETAGLLQTLPAVFHTRIDEALLSALARAVAGWTGSPRLRVDLEGHGREPIFEDLDVSRTVGWFTSLYPVVLEAGDAGPGEALVSAKERLRAVPERGIGYGLLCNRIPEAPEAEISFNYLGQVDATFDALSLFKPSSDSAGPMQSARAHRAYPLKINGIVTDGRLRMILTYGTRTHRRETMDRLAASYAGALRELIQHSRQSEEVFTPSDFPKAGLDARSFESLAALLACKNVEDIYPLTPLQNGMLFHSLMSPESGVYVTQVTCTFPADLDTGLYRQAWERLIDRHGVLRTAFLWDGLDEPLQVVSKKVSLPWQELDWCGLSVDEQQRRFEELRHRERHTPLPLDKAPLMRLSLIRLGREHGLIWTAHHLLLDGWSLPLLVQELKSVYSSASSALPPVRPFSDYVVWLHKQDLSRAEPFWRGELAGFTAPNAVGIDRPARIHEGAGNAEHGLRISREITARLQALASRHKLTLPTVTLGAWAVLLSRYSREEDVVFGNVVSGRPAALPGVETMVGMFINTLPVRVRIDGAEPLILRLQHLQERQLARQEFEHSPLAQIQRWSEIPAGSPLFETLHVFESYPNSGEGGSSRLRVDNLRVFESTNYPVTLTLTVADQISLKVMCDLARVDEDAARRLPGHLATLLAGMAEEAEWGGAIAELPLLGLAERQQLLVEWNDTEARSLPGCLHHDVAAQAARTPAAVAVEMGEERWTYRRLIGSARRLARRLRTLGIGPDGVVGLCGERSPALVVGMLAVLEAGGAWLPLDPDLPAERLGFLLADAGARVLLIQEHLTERVPAAGLPVVLLDESWDSGEEMGEALGVEVSPDDLAYVIYTSGSTGQPKGVMVPHQGICNRLRWAKRVYGIGEHDAFLQKAAPGFDVSVWESFAPLTAGARLVLAEPGRQADGAYLVRAIREHHVTLVNFVPAMLAAFLDEAEARACVSLRQVFVGGEELSPELRDRTLASLPIPLDNMYGPTEITVDTTHWVCAPGQSPHRVPIGRPIGNSRVYVVDRELRPVPLGVAGELAVGGEGVTRGYLGQPGLTAERFVPDPFGGRPGGRMYRTGDLGRWLPDGSLEFLGRTDHQVKIRGVRIELGEIEAALVSIPEVREAAVVMREEVPGDRRLVAYVTGEVTSGELRRLLKERLPDSMVPSAFVTLPALPLTVNGKVDRKALSTGSAPEPTGAGEGYVAPRTHEEELLTAVWAQVLRRPRVGVDDNYFELGGDSILSVQIVARCRQAGLLFTVRQIFEHQTVAELARYATLAESAGANLAGQGPVTGEVPLTPIQRWFFEQGFADPHHFNQALLLESREPLDPAALERAMAAIVEHHDTLRMRFERTSDGWRQENAPAESVSIFCCIDLAGLPAPRVEDAFEQAAASLQAGFDLGSGPLTRLCLFEVGAGKASRLLWAAHHLVVDGVSWRLLLADLEAAYRQAERGLRPTLPPRTSSFQEWSRRLSAHASSAAVARELDFWRETVRVAMPRLPVDFPEAGVLVGDRDTVSFELSAEETADLLQTLPAVYHNRIDEALLSALARAVSRWAGSPRLRVDLEGHGREPLFEDLDVSRTVGWFTSLYPVVLEAGEAGPGEALVSAKERLRAVPERGIGYGLLRDRLPEAPAAEISFNYLGQVDATFDTLSLFRASSASAGPMQSPRSHRAYPLEINGIVSNGRLRMVLTYGRRMHRRETVERLAAAYAGALRELIRHSRESEEVFTPSDFPKAGLDARNFEKLAALLAEPD